MLKTRFLVFALLAALCLSCTSAPPPQTSAPAPATSDAGPEAPEPTLILISLDGFRWDFLDRGVTPTLSRLAAAGVHAERLIPSFPSKTFPNHYT
ncbi:MAG: alkaline phosphatase family protein, partial [Thermoanaerobaculia bacterium]